MQLTTLSLTLLALTLNACTKEIVSGDRSAAPAPTPTAPSKAKPNLTSARGQVEGTETQNGGYGIEIDGHIYSLDLFMRGTHMQPYLSDDLEDILTNEERATIVESLPFANPAVQKIVVNKLSHLKRLAQTAKGELPVSEIIAGIKRHTWIYLPERACADVGDNTSPFTDDIVQLAYREGRWIRFCRGFTQADDPNKAAVIVHEIIYAGMRRKSYTNELTGLLFHAGIKTPTPELMDEFRDIASALVQNLRTFRPTSPVLPARIQPAPASAERGEPRVSLATIVPFELYNANGERMSSGTMVAPGNITRADRVLITRAGENLMIEFGYGDIQVAIFGAENQSRLMPANDETQMVAAYADAYAISSSQLSAIKVYLVDGRAIVYKVGTEATTAGPKSEMPRQDMDEFRRAGQNRDQNQEQNTTKQAGPKRDLPQQEGLRQVGK